METTATPVERDIDARFPASAVPSITGVHLSNGDVVTLVNISRSGVLVEGRTRFIPGARASLVFEGTFKPSEAKGRIVRCMVSSVDGGSLVYQSGIEFEKRLDRDPVGQPATAPTTPSQAKAAAQHVESIDVTPAPRQNRWY
jgi:hypothetical protein